MTQRDKIDRKTGIRIGSWPSLVRRSGLVCVLVGDRIGDVAKVMTSANIGAVLVLRNDGILAGIFTERDLLRWVGIGVVGDPLMEEVMTRDPWGISLEDDAQHVARSMLARGFRHAVVFDGDRTPVGIVSMRDILAMILEE